MENILLNTKAALATIPNIHERTKMRASNESLDDVVHKVAGYVTRTLDSVKSVFIVSGDKLNGFKTGVHSEHLKQLLNLELTINNIVNSGIKMGDVSRIQTPVTIGMQTDLLVWSLETKEAVKLVDKHLLQMLKDTDLIVSKMLSDKNYIKSTRPIKYETEPYEITNKLYKVIDKLIDENGTKDRRNLDTVIPSINSLTDILTNFKTTENNFDVNNLEYIKKYSKTIASKVATLKEYLNDNPELEVSTVVLNNFGYKLEDTAKLLTLSISILHMFNQGIDMLTNAVMLIEKFKK